MNDLKNLIKNIFLSVLATIIIIYVLFSGQPVGLSDSGDFGRIVSSNGLEYTVPVEERRFIYQNTFYISFKGDTKFEKLFNALFHVEDFWHYPSIQNVFVKLSIGANILVNTITGTDSHVYRFEVLGFIYTLFYGLALFALLSSIRIKQWWLDTIIKLLIIVMLCDVGYVLYFNSFYGEALQNIFLVFSVAYGIRLFNDTLKKRHYILFTLSLLGYGWSKFANIPVTVLALIFFLPGVLMLLDKTRRRFAVLTTSVVLVFLLFLYLSIPKWMDFQTNYNTVFFGILRNTDEHQTHEYVKELELPPYTEKFENTNYYLPSVTETLKSDRFKADFSKINKFKIALFYLKHPGYFLEKLQITARNSVMLKPTFLSNYGPDNPRLTFCRTFELWGGLRKLLPFDNWAFNLIFLLSTLIYLCFQGWSTYRKNRPRAWLFFGAALAITGSTFYNFCIPYIANGEGDIAKHLFAFIQNVDFMVMLLAYLLLAGLSRIAAHLIRMSLPRLATTLFFILCVSVAFSCTDAFYPSHKATLTGSTLEFGTFHGKKITWQIIGEENGICTLLGTEPIAQSSFSDSVPQNAMLKKYGSNLWIHSKIRTFLNGDFLKGFSGKEKALMEFYNHKVILSIGNLSLKSGGDQELFWSYIPTLAARDYDSSYFMNAEDKVTLPSLKQIDEMNQKGLAIKRAFPYWLDTPYYNNDSMVRIVETDGYVYMKDAVVEEIGVVPCIRLRSGWDAEGEGSLENPLRIIYPTSAVIH